MKTNTEVLNQVIEECWSNPGFIETLKKDPVVTIEKLTGQKVELPEGVSRIEVVDQTNPNVININIPEQPNLDNMELSEKEMEIVSGGSPTGLLDIRFRRVWELPIIVCGHPVDIPVRPEPVVINKVQ